MLLNWARFKQLTGEIPDAWTFDKHAKTVRRVLVPAMAVALVYGLGHAGMLAPQVVANILCGIVAGIAAR